MTKPTIGQTKWLALLLALFFALTSVGQFLFVQRQTRATVERQLDRRANEIDSAVDYREGVDLRALDRAIVDVTDYVTILGNDDILDLGTSQRLIPRLIPDVKCPVLSDAAYSHPVDTTYTTLEGTSERWWILAKKLDGGIVVVGISALDEVQFPEQKLKENVAAFGTTIEAAQRLNAKKLDEAISAWAVITDSGQLVGGYGRIPLQFKDRMAMDSVALGDHERRVNGRTYLVLYSPLRDSSNATGRRVGTIVVPQDITTEQEALRSQVKFNATIGGTSFLLFLILSVLYSSRHEEEKRQIREAFQHYFSPQILETILREPGLLTLGGQRREVTILFSDIRSFTSLSEKIPPQQLARILQEYFTAMTDEVLATDGVVDKYIGDAIMAFWGAPIEQPDQANRAVRTAVAMIQRLKKLQEQWRADGHPTFDIGVGINLGVATVGNMGSSKRFDYTVIGDAVNAASRIEGLNKTLDSHILISDSTKQQLTIAVRTRDRGEVPVRGKEKPIRVFEVEVE